MKVSFAVMALELVVLLSELTCPKAAAASSRERANCLSVFIFSFPWEEMERTEARSFRKKLGGHPAGHLGVQAPEAVQRVEAVDELSRDRVERADEAQRESGVVVGFLCDLFHRAFLGVVHGHGKEREGVLVQQE